MVARGGQPTRGSRLRSLRSRLAGARSVRRVRRRRLCRAVGSVVHRAGLPAATTAPVVLGSRRCVVRVDCDDGRTLIAKGAFGDRLDREVRAHRWAAEAGVPVAPLVAVLPGPPQVMLTEQLSGGALASARDPEPWRDAGAVLRRLHDAPRPWPVSPGAPAPDDWHRAVGAEVTRAVERDGLPSDLAELASATLAAHAPAVVARSRPTVVHGDCMPADLLRDDEGRWCLIDLEYLRIDDPAWDLAVLCAFEPERLDDVVAGYAPDQNEEQRLRQLVPARRLERLVRAVNWQLDHGVALGPVLEVLAEHLRSGPVAGGPGALSR